MTTKPLPLPRLAFRVGITGHRPEHLEQCGADLGTLRERTDAALLAVRDAVDEIHAHREAPFADEAPLLRFVSSLAEGSDRLTAVAALDAGYELQVILPFRQEEYEKDFAGHVAPDGRASLEEFRTLLGRASAVMDLDADPTARSRYVAAGLSLVRQCDVLLAIWDGEPSDGPGGSAENVAEAVHLGIPVVWIDAVRRRRHEMGLTRARAGGLVRDAWNPADLRRRIRDQLLLAPGHERAHGPGEPPERPLDALTEFLVAAEPPTPAIPVFAMASRVLSVGADGSALRAELQIEDALLAEPDAGDAGGTTPMDPFERDIFRCVAASERTPALERLVEHVRPLFGGAFLRADHLAVGFGARYRSDMTWAYLAAFGAILAALGMVVGMGGDGEAGPFLAACEVALLGWIWYLYDTITSLRLHRRWVDCRSLAEKLRHVIIRATLGSPSLEVPLPPTLDASDDRAHWTNWYLRALVRCAGVLPVRLSDPAVRRACRTLLHSWLLTDQARYHFRGAVRTRTIHARTSLWRDAAFAGTVVLAVVHLALSLLPPEQRAPASVELAIGAFGVVLPVIAAALHAYGNQLDFEGTARRSTGELRHLRDAWREISTGSDLSSVELMRITGLVSEGALGELVEWRSDLVSRPPTIP